MFKTKAIQPRFDTIINQPLISFECTREAFEDQRGHCIGNASIWRSLTGSRHHCEFAAPAFRIPIPPQLALLLRGRAFGEWAWSDPCISPNCFVRRSNKCGTILGPFAISISRYCQAVNTFKTASTIPCRRRRPSISSKTIDDFMNC